MVRKGGLAELVQGVRSAQGLAAEPVEALALVLLSEFSWTELEALSRRNAINGVTQRLGLGGPSRRVASRLLAEGWQLLEQNRLICRDPDQTHGDWWFLTRAGRAFLDRDDDVTSLRAALLN